MKTPTLKEFVFDNIGLIFASNQYDVIGDGKAMPWHIPEDLKHFRNVTEGHYVLMGRKTWESIPEKYRPLPNRRNIIMTRGTGVYEGAETVRYLSEALLLAREAAGEGKKFWVVGGGEIYDIFRSFASTVERTLVCTGPTEGVQAPRIIPGDRGWKLAKLIPFHSTTNVECCFMRMERGQRRIASRLLEETQPPVRVAPLVLKEEILTGLRKPERIKDKHFRDLVHDNYESMATSFSYIKGVINDPTIGDVEKLRIIRNFTGISE